MTRFTAPVTLPLALTLAMLAVFASPVRADEVGTIAAVDGSAELGRGEVWGVATPGQAVAVGDQLRTGRDGRMRIVFRDDSVLLLGESTTLLVNEHVFNPSASRSLLSLVEGKLKSVVSHYYGAAGSSYEVQTPTAVAGVRGTEFVMSYDPTTGATEVVGIRGVVTVHSAVDPAGPGMLVTANEATAVAEGALPSPLRHVDPARMRELLHDMEFFGSSQSLTDASTLIAGTTVPRPARAPASSVGRAMVLAPEGPPLGIDAPTALGNSPAAIIAGGGRGSIGVNPGHP